MKSSSSVWVLLLAAAVAQGASTIPSETTFTNSIGMKLARIAPGTFKMGQGQTPLPSDILPMFRGRGRIDAFRDGDFDEKPAHKVRITKPFYMGVFEVTNEKYELFDPEHKQLRGKEGYSKENNEAVVYVDWYRAEAFCRWLSEKEGLPYRLPTEAEWEYACRAESATHFHTGDDLPEAFRQQVKSTSKAVTVGRTPPNAWGLYDMHGNVEEWCLDWYGPYRSGSQVDPVGFASGDFRVTRGGSVGTDIYYLRSANRLGTLPEDRHPLIGFRVVLGELPKTKPSPPPPLPLNQQKVVQRDPAKVSVGPDLGKPYFHGVRSFVKMPVDANGPLFAAHNHDPAIVACPNGDLLAIWYTCVSETDRELAQVASRLRWGADDWEPASPFWDVPDRNDHAPSLWNDGRGTLYHFTGVAYAGGHYYNALVMRTSRDSGATWSAARIIRPEYQRSANMPSEPVIRLRDGAIALVSDGGGSHLYISRDEGLTWNDPGGRIKGIHAGLVELKDGRLFGMGRTDENPMPISISSDGGKTFTYHDSEFPGVGGAQRLVLMRLREGPLFLAGFADLGIKITDASGKQREVRGVYGALSFDEGKTWPHKRLISDDGPGQPIETTGGGLVIMSERNSEYRGYMAGCQGYDDVIHLITSRSHFAFDLKWLTTPPPPERYPPVRVKPVVETFAGPKKFDAEGWASYKGYNGGFNGKGQYTIESLTHNNGINRILGAGSYEATVSFNNIRFYHPGPNVSEGLAIRIWDARARTFSFTIKENGITIGADDKDPVSTDPRPRTKGAAPAGIALTKPPTSAKVKLVWNEKTRRMRAFYGLNGAEAVTEVPQSEAGVCYEKPFTEATSIFFLMSNGSVDIDHFEMKP